MTDYFCKYDNALLHITIINGVLKKNANVVIICMI